MPPKKQQKITRYYPTNFQRLRQDIFNFLPEDVERYILESALPNPITRQRFRELALPHMAIAFLPQEQYDSWLEQAYNHYLQVFNTTSTNQLGNPDQHAEGFIEDKLNNFL